MPRPGFSTSARVALLLAVLACFASLPGVGLRDLWNPDEPRYAEVAREMQVLSDWVVPHLNGEIYAEKPPLFFWLSALAQAAGLGFGAGSLVSALSIGGIMFLCWRLARSWFGPRAAWLAAAIVPTTALFCWIGRMGVLDPLLSFTTMLAVYGLAPGGGSPVWIWVGSALGILVKGPVALLIVALAALAFALTGSTPRRSGRHWRWGMALMLAIVAGWVVPACIQGGREYTDTILFRQTVGRVHRAMAHDRPFWYYLPTLPLFLFPWIFFVPRAFLWAWRHRGAPRALLVWFAFGLVVFSAVSGKRERYLLPLYPAVALLVAGYLDGALEVARRGHAPRAARRLLRWQHGVCLGFGVFFLLFAAAGGEVLDGYAASHPLIVAAARPLTTFPGALALVGAGLLVGGISVAGMAVARRGPLPRAVALLVAAMLSIWWSFDLVWTPRINVFKSARPAAERMSALLPPEAGEVGFFPDTFAGSFNLYAGRIRMPVLKTVAEFDAFLRETGKKRGVVTSRGHFERSTRYGDRPVKDQLSSRWFETELRRVGHRIMVLVTNFDPGADSGGGGG